jgi:hypothetical protein
MKKRTNGRVSMGSTASKHWLYWLVVLMIAILLILFWYTQQNIARIRQEMEKTIPAPATHLK